jgi:hypothetical protein
MRKTLLTRLIAVILLSSFVFASACGEAAKTQPEVTTAAAADGDVTEAVSDGTTDRADYVDSLPDDLDFGGARYNILCQKSTDLSSLAAANEMVTEELDGDVLNDAVYNRALKVMNRLNVEISKTVVDDVNKTVRQSVAAGDNAFEIIAAYAYYITPLALEELFVNWLKIPYIDLNQPWWPSTLSEDLIIQDSLFFVSGDISMRLLEYTYCMYFNKAIAESWNIPEMYPLVLDGKWVLDKYMEIASGVSSDLDGDGKYTVTDLFGTMNNHYCDVRFSCYDIPISRQTEDGLLELCVMTDKFVDVYTRLHEYYRSSDAIYTHVDNTTSIKAFKEDHLLFYPYLIVGAENFRDMENDYGIIPYPKYDEKQERYMTLAHDNYSLMCVPLDVPEDNLEMIGAVTEAFAAESYRTITPTYLEVVLKNKFLRDSYSSAMLDIITSGMKFDPAGIYSNSLGDPLHLFRGVWDGKIDIVSTYTKKEKTFNKYFDKFNEKYSELAG